MSKYHSLSRLALAFVTVFSIIITTNGQIRMSKEEFAKDLQRLSLDENKPDSICEYSINYFSYADTAELYPGLKVFSEVCKDQKQFEGSYLLMLGIVRKRKRQYDSALVLFREALKNAIDESYYPLICHANIQLGKTYKALSNYPIALLSYDEAVTVASEANDNDALISSYIDKGELYFELASYNRSLQFLNAAYAFSGREKKRIGNLAKAAILKDKIECFEKLNNLDSLQAIKRKLDSLPLDYEFIYFTKISAGIEEDRMLNNNQREIFGLHKLIALLRKTMFDDPLEAAISLGKVYYRSGQYNEALHMLDSVEFYLDKFYQPNLLKELYAIKAKTLTAMNNTQLAIDYYKKMERIYDTISSSSSIAKNIDMSVSVSTLRNNLDEATHAKEVQRKLLILTVVISVLTLSLLYLLFRYVVNNHKLQKMRVQQQMKELSFINSHEVRRYLANILGIVQAIKADSTPFNIYLHFEDKLFENANALDESIKNLARKLYGEEGQKSEA